MLSLIVLLPIIQYPVGVSAYVASQKGFRMMTYNAWNSGSHVNDGERKTLKHIDSTGRETPADFAKQFVKKLGSSWVGVFSNNGQAIFTRHSFVPNTEFSNSRGIGAKILLSNGKIIAVWSMYLTWKSYGPYKVFDQNITKLEQITNIEYSSRGWQIRDLLAQNEMQMWMNESEHVPVFVGGDFNSPSHLDWTEQTKERHRGWVVEWPATKLLEQAGFVDTYRKVYPNALKDPGYTWSPVMKYNIELKMDEPQDRIDFLFYKGHIIAEKCETYYGNKNEDLTQNVEDNDYPSDHAAVVADYVFK
ncbi:hypothetical protein CAEBREN_16719 [Caenorhabditis brenneri]|uniref:Endonuclease/exonuclease/phosphatase domain-containing protein n=1 Tax=Caenorhabditis brenneri TaxID=135651 RepID=G0MRN3_CAEBE|nr:hypothetical protein CAEBREN_16719 [Caenorhabditis brenneri]